MSSSENWRIGFQTRKKSRAGTINMEVDYGSGKWVYKPSEPWMTPMVRLLL